MAYDLDIQTIVTEICRQAFDDKGLSLSGLEKVLPDDWGRNRIWRYQVKSNSLQNPKTIIVKISKLGNGHIFHEWASLEFLSQFEMLSALLPDFYGGNAKHELLVLEDLGDARNQDAISHLLEGTGATAARQAVIDHAIYMAHLHRATLEHEAQFQEIRGQFPQTERLIEKDQFDTHFEWIQAALPRFGISVSDQFQQELALIIKRMHAPDALRAYTRGDVCPSNVTYQDRQMRFYDFEMGRYRNLFLSVVYFRLSHVSCMNGSLIPVSVQIEAEKAYFDEMASVIANVSDYQADYAGAAIAMMMWMLSNTLEKKERPRHLATRHQRAFAAISLFLDNSFFTKPYPAVTKTMQALQIVLIERWSQNERTIPLFSALNTKLDEE